VALPRVAPLLLRRRVARRDARGIERLAGGGQQGRRAAGGPRGRLAALAWNPEDDLSGPDLDAAGRVRDERGDQGGSLVEGAVGRFRAGRRRNRDLEPVRQGIAPTG
jgi:hypothetical protein